MTLEENAFFEFTADATPTNCEFATNGSIIFDLVATEDPYLFSIDGGQTFQDEAQFNDLANGTYQLIVEDANGCLSPMQTITIENRSDLELILPENYQLRLGDSLQLDSFYTNFTPQTYVWTASQAISCDTCAYPFFKPNESTTYQLTVTDAYGCSASSQLDIFVNQQRDFYLPTAFSPNGDNFNDFFTVASRPNFIETIEDFSIFSRWGELVFQQQNIHPQDFRGWDGQLGSNAAMPGIYIFMIKVKTQQGVVETLKGEVVLMR